MKDKDIIQLLKDNLYTFGLWPEAYGKETGEAMQAKIKSISYANILCLQSEPQVVWTICGPKLDFTDANNFTNTFRLREDYTEPEPEPEAGVEKCKVYLNSPTEAYPILVFDWNGYNLGIDCACNFSEFIGYLYEDGQVSILARRFKSKANGANYHPLPIAWFEEDTVEVLTPTHVLFRKQ